MRKRDPRPYQIEAIDLVRASLAKGNKRVLLCLATGAGKSVIANLIVDMAAAKKTFVLYTVHRLLLRDQMRLEMNGKNNIVVDTLQSLKRRYFDDVGLVIADEAHYGSNSKLQEDILSRYDCPVIGMTATPINPDGSKLDGWDDVIDVVQLADLIKLGFAAPIRLLSPATVDRSHFRTQSGDYNGKDVAEEVTKNFIVQNVVQKFLKYGEGRRSIFYCINISHTETLQRELIENGIRAAAYHSNLHKDERQKIFDAFVSGDLDVLTTVETLTTGVDVPDIYCLVLASPTKSMVKAVQIFGRGTRLDPKNKDKDCLILDMAGVIEDTIHPLDRMDFNKERKKRGRECGCGGGMFVLKRTAKDELIACTVTTTWKCKECGNVEVDISERAIEDNFCLECETEIEKGTAIYITETTEKEITFVSICPHCQNKKVMRKVELVDFELVEAKANVRDWRWVERQLKAAKNKDGKKYHHRWVTRVMEGMDGYDIKLVVRVIERYQKNNWALGGILNVLSKKVV